MRSLDGIKENFIVSFDLEVDRRGGISSDFSDKKVKRLTMIISFPIDCDDGISNFKSCLFGRGIWDNFCNFRGFLMVKFDDGSDSIDLIFQECKKFFCIFGTKIGSMRIIEFSEVSGNTVVFSLREFFRGNIGRMQNFDDLMKCFLRVIEWCLESRCRCLMRKQD